MVCQKIPLNPIPTGGGGLSDPHCNKCLRNSENRKDFKQTSTNYDLEIIMISHKLSRSEKV